VEVLLFQPEVVIGPLVVEGVNSHTLCLGHAEQRCWPDVGSATQLSAKSYDGNLDPGLLHVRSDIIPELKCV
jgi:hypothetical protein